DKMATCITDFTVYISDQNDCLSVLNGYNAVTSLSFLAFLDKQTQTPYNWQFWNSNDLNIGSGGKYIYMVWNKGEEGLRPIVEIDFCISENNKINEKKYFIDNTKLGFE
ncbi:11043_t:CDS:2, partial [Gigaspora margarita]